MGLTNGGGICRTFAKSEGTFLPEGYSKYVKYTHGTNSENESYRTDEKYVIVMTRDGKVKSSLDWMLIFKKFNKFRKWA